MSICVPTHNQEEEEGLGSTQNIMAIHQDGLDERLGEAGARMTRS
jgi:hypothetical protein